MLAAAARFALEHHRERLADDHANARRLADALEGAGGVAVPLRVETNMVFFDVTPRLGTAAEFCARLKARGIWMLPTATQRVRAVCHLDVDRAGIDRAVGVVRELAGAPSGAVGAGAR